MIIVGFSPILSLKPLKPHSGAKRLVSSGYHIHSAVATLVAHSSFLVRLDVFTNQPAMQAYTGGNFKEIPRKAVHGGPDLNYTKFSAVVLEQQGVIDAINNPEWNVDQICESSPAHTAAYSFRPFFFYQMARIDHSSSIPHTSSPL